MINFKIYNVSPYFYNNCGLATIFQIILLLLISISYKLVTIDLSNNNKVVMLLNRYIVKFLKRTFV